MRELNSRLEEAERREEHWKGAYKKVEQERLELLSRIYCEQCRTSAEGELWSKCNDKRTTREELKTQVAHWKQQYESLSSLCTCHGGSSDGPSKRL